MFLLYNPNIILHTFLNMFKTTPFLFLFFIQKTYHTIKLMLVKCKFSLVSKSFNILIMKATNGDEKSSLNCMGLKPRVSRVLCQH